MPKGRRSQRTANNTSSARHFAEKLVNQVQERIEAKFWRARFRARSRARHARRSQCLNEGTWNYELHIGGLDTGIRKEMRGCDAAATNKKLERVFFTALDTNDNAKLHRWELTPESQHKLNEMTTETRA